MAEKICGQDMSHPKGKTTRCNPTATTTATIATPKELKEKNKQMTSH